MLYKQHHRQPRPTMFCQSSLQLVIDSKVHSCNERCTMPEPHVMSSRKRYYHYKDHDYACVCSCALVRVRGKSQEYSPNTYVSYLQKFKMPVIFLNKKEYLTDGFKLNSSLNPYPANVNNMASSYQC